MNGKEFGTVITWRADRGFGFVKRDDGGPDCFVHLGEVPGVAPEVGQRLRFVVTLTDRGPRASAIELLPERNGGRR